MLYSGLENSKLIWHNVNSMNMSC